MKNIKIREALTQNNMKQWQLADYLGVERSAMSYEISKLQKQGYIETNRSYFKLL